MEELWGREYEKEPSPMFHLSYGSEFEFDGLSLLVHPHASMSSSDKLQKYELMRHGELVYGDKFSPTRNMMDRVLHFLGGLDGSMFYRLRFDKSWILLQQKDLLEDGFFNDLEIITTYDEPIAVEEKNLCRYFWKKLRKSFHNLRIILKEFGNGALILDDQFPYEKIYRHENIHHLHILQSYHDIPLKKAYFTPQCTFGVDLPHAKSLLDMLIQFYLDNVVSSADKLPDIPIHRVQQQCIRWCNKVFRGRKKNWKRMSDYCHLFLFSYLTRGERRMFPFLFRNLFSDLWRTFLEEEGRSLLHSMLKETFSQTEPELVDYFEKVHGLMKCSMHPDELENMSDSTRFLDTDRFFIEFRGLDLLLRRIMSRCAHELVDDISLEVFLNMEKLLGDRFCETYE